jgi:hypothetical protein
VGHGLLTGCVRGGDQLAPGLAPGVRIAAGRQDLALVGEDRAPPELARDLLQVLDRTARIRKAGSVDGGGHRGPDVAATGIWSKIASVTLEQGSWLTVVIFCGIAVVLLAVGGYTGYSIVVGAVGLAAAVNLL